MYTTLQGGSSYAISFSFVEGDSQCGPGEYRLTSLVLSLSRPASSPPSVPMVISLYSAEENGVPITLLSTGSFGSATVALPSTDVTNVSLALPVAMTADNSANPLAVYSFVMSPQSTLYWNAPTSGAAPSAGFGQPVGLFSVVNGAGNSWVALGSQAYGVVRLAAVKTICSPTPTSTQTQSQSATQTQTRSGTLSKSQSQSASETRTSSVTTSATQTQSRTRSQSRTSSGTQSPSQTLTASLTQSNSQAQTPSTSQTASISSTPSSSASHTQTSTASLTPSSTQSESASQAFTPSVSSTLSQHSTPSQSPSLTGSRSPSQTASVSYSSTQSASPTSTGHPEQPVFDNTADRTAGFSGLLQRVLQKPASGSAIANSDSTSAPRRLSSYEDVQSGSFGGVVFVLNESDSMCGPGRYDFTNLYLALSAPVSGQASLTVQLWQNNAASLPSTIRGQYVALVDVQTYPTYVNVALPGYPSFFLDSSADGPVNYTITFQVGRRGNDA